MDIAAEVQAKARAAKEASRVLALAPTRTKNEVLSQMARGLEEKAATILEANRADHEKHAAGYYVGLIDGEAGPGLQLAGAGVAWSPLARFGVATGSVSRSEGDSAGTQWSGGYQWFGQRAGFDVNVQRADAGYRDLGTLDGGGAPLRGRTSAPTVDRSTTTDGMAA